MIGKKLAMLVAGGMVAGLVGCGGSQPAAEAPAGGETPAAAGEKASCSGEGEKKCGGAAEGAAPAEGAPAEGAAPAGDAPAPQ